MADNSFKRNLAVFVISQNTAAVRFSYDLIPTIAHGGTNFVLFGRGEVYGSSFDWNGNKIRNAGIRSFQDFRKEGIPRIVDVRKSVVREVKRVRKDDLKIFCEPFENPAGIIQTSWRTDL